MLVVTFPRLKTICIGLFSLMGLQLMLANCQAQIVGYGSAITYNSDRQITSISHHREATALVELLTNLSGKLDACSTITLGQHDITGDEISAIAKSIKKLKTLIIGGPGEEVQLSSAGVKSLESIPTLEELFVFADVESQSDWSSLRMNNSMRSLTISGELELGQFDVNAIGQLQNLKNLELRGIINSNSSSWLSSLKALERLDIESKSMDSAFCEYVAKLPQVTQLRISGCPISISSLRLIATAHGSRFEQLDLEIEDIAAASILREFRSLQHLAITVPENSSLDLSFLAELKLIKSLSLRGMAVQRTEFLTEYFESSNLRSILVTDRIGTIKRFSHSK